MSNKDLAGALKVSENSVSNWTTGKYLPGHDRAQQIAGALGMTMDQLYGRTTTSTAASAPAQPAPPSQPAGADDEARQIIDRLAALELDTTLTEVQRITPPLMDILAAARRLVDQGNSGT